MSFAINLSESLVKNCCSSLFNFNNVTFGADVLQNLTVVCIRPLLCVFRRDSFPSSRTIGVNQGSPPLRRGVNDTESVPKVFAVQGSEQRY